MFSTFGITAQAVNIFTEYLPSDGIGMVMKNPQRCRRLLGTTSRQGKTARKKRSATTTFVEVKSNIAETANIVCLGKLLRWWNLPTFPTIREEME